MRPAAVAALIVVTTSLNAYAQRATVEAGRAALTDEQKANALDAIKSHQPSRRRDAYKTFHRLGDSGKADYVEVLENARAFHAEAFSSRALKLAVEKNSLSQFEELYSEWQASRAAAYGMVKTNWKDKEPNDYKERYAEMDALFADASATFERLVRLAPRAGKSELDSLSKFPEILQEIDVELAWARGELVIVAGPPDLLITLKSSGGERLYSILKSLLHFRQVLADAEAVAAHNDGSRWANAAQKGFATLLNGRRVILGQPALRLDEKLSMACRGHSAEMEQLGYFAHESPIPENRSPSKRAKKAGFEGNYYGECIFAGNSSPNSAHGAWWYSDGHRTIMYAKGTNTLGLGLVSKLWTLNTAKKRW